MSLYRQVFWKCLELGIIPDFMLRSKIKSGLKELLEDLQGDGNVETQQTKLNEFLEEIVRMPIAINQSNANEQHYEVPSEFYLKVLGPFLKYSCGFWPKSDTTLEQSEVEMLEMYCQRANLNEGKILPDFNRISRFNNFRSNCFGSWLRLGFSVFVRGGKVSTKSDFFLEQFRHSKGVHLVHRG